MKFLLTTLLLTSFLSIAVFGVFGMNSNIQNHEGGCIFSFIKGVDCPKQNNLFNYFIFHINAYKDFVLATLNENGINALMFAFMFLFFVSQAFFLPPLFCSPSFVLYGHRFKNPFSLSQKQEFTRWLALHENSPAAL